MMSKLIKKFSLRSKLVLLYSILLLFSTLIISYYSYWDIWQILIKNKATHIRARAKPIIEYYIKNKGLINSKVNPYRLAPNTALQLVRDLTSRDTVAVILNKYAKIIANGKRLPEEPETTPIKKDYLDSAIKGNNDITYLDYQGGKRSLVFLIPIRSAPSNKKILGVIQISTTLSDINKILFHHGYRQVTAAVIVLILGILSGYWLIGINLKKLKNLSILCDKTSKGNFKERINVSEKNDEIDELAYSFNTMIDKIEKLFNTQKRFVANASHELLTPLTGLQGSIEVLLRGAQDDPKTVNKLSKGMYREVNHLIQLCEQLLELSRLEGVGSINKKKILINEFLNNFRKKAIDLTKRHSIIYQDIPNILISADPVLLEHIFYNIISNAVHYSPSNTPINVKWELSPDYVKFVVSDHGIGMDKETLSHIFEPFHRGKNRNFNHREGYGLGLALTKTLIEAHGGIINVESSYNKGTKVSFTLPIS